MGLFVKMSNGANYSIVPFINRRALGGVAGIVGAGGNAGAVLAGFLFKTTTLTYSQAFLILGIVILLSAPAAYFVGRGFSPAVGLLPDATNALTYPPRRILSQPHAIRNAHAMKRIPD